MNTCPHCKKEFPFNNYSRHVKNCLSSPEILKELSNWVEQAATEVAGKRIFPAASAYEKKAKDAGLPSRDAIQKHFGSWSKFGKTIAPHLVVRESTKKVISDDDRKNLTIKEMNELRNKDGVVMSYDVSRESVTYHHWLRIYGIKKFCEENGIAYQTKWQSAPQIIPISMAPSEKKQAMIGPLGLIAFRSKRVEWQDRAGRTYSEMRHELR